MKKTIVLIFLCFVFSNTFSQIINIPDANFKAKLLESDSGVGIAYGVGGSFKIDANNNGEIEVSEVLPVRSLYVDNSNISDLTGIEYFTNMTRLGCDQNALTTLDVTMLPNLGQLSVYSNNLTNLNVSGLSALGNLFCSDNQLLSIDLSGLTNLTLFNIEDNELSSLDFSDSPNLHIIECSNNQITSIDVSNVTELSRLNCSFNQLETLNIKNDFSELEIDFSDNDNLQYICADDFQIIEVENKIIEYGYTNCFANSLCSFVPGEDFYTVSGNVQYDENGDGCDLANIDFQELTFSFSDGTNSGTIFVDPSGNYTYSVQSGNYTFTPILANTEYFNITPNSFTVIFPEDASANIQDFCVVANDVYPDLSITMEYFDEATDPFVTYKLKYKNKGTMTQSGDITLTFDDIMAVFSSAEPMISSQSGNTLTWDFTDLTPLESREIEFTMDLTAIVDSVGGGEVIVNYVASIDSSLMDATPDDNVFEYNEPFYCCLGIVEFVFSDYFQLYPNPTNDILNLKMKKDIDVKSIEVYNVLGQRIGQLSFENRNTKIDASNFKFGTLFSKNYHFRNNFYNKVY